MKTISKFLIFTLVLLLACLGVVSATGNVTDTADSQDSTHNSDIQTYSVLDDNNIQTNSKVLEKKYEKNKTLKQAGRTITVTNKTFDTYFKQSSEDEFPSSTSLIQDGDTVNLKGSFKNCNFAVDKHITFTSLNKDAKLYDSTVFVLGDKASGSKITNLNIFNNGTLIRGIQVKNASNLVVENNTIKTLGLRSYGFVADNMNHSSIRFNSFEREGDDWRYITFLIGKCYYNNIANNTIRCGGANGIYLSIYGSIDAKFEAGPSDYNNITGNNVTARGDITSWCYTIQVMGGNNRISYNTVNGGFRGISTQDYENNIITYNDVHAINEGIYACEGAVVSNNNVHVTDTSYGITIGSDNVRVKDNTIKSVNGAGIEIRGSNAQITGNTIISENSTGIHSKGTYTNIIIDNNKINSKEEGILFKQQSNTKKINHIMVTRNTITTDAEYAVNLEETGSQYDADVNVTVTTSNVLTANKLSGMESYKKPVNANSNTDQDTNQVITVTDNNYNTWFTDGIQKSSIKQNATVNLEGTFKDKSFTFNKKVHITGKNCVILDGTITLTGDAHASTINSITIRNKAHNTTVHGIELIEVNNCRITNTKIDNYAEYESLGIFLYGSNGNIIQSNTLTTSGDYVNNGILTYSSDSNKIEDNKININQSGKPVAYADSIMFNERIGTIQEVLHNHGIILLYSSGNNINKNTVTGTSEFKKYTFPTNDCRNSIVGIDLYFNCNDNRITENNININGYGPYNYGMGVLGGQWGTSIYSVNASNNQYISNNVTLTGGYFATGFIAGRNSAQTIIKNNNIRVDVYKQGTNRGDYAHGITLENSTTSTITGNNIYLTASSIYSIELFDSGNNKIISNNIQANGTYPYGIAGTRAINNEIQNNTIILKEENMGPTSQATHSESIESGKEGIMLTQESTNNIITYNTIHTNTQNTIKLEQQTRNNQIKTNSLVSKTGTGDKTVNNKGINNITNNFQYFTNITTTPITARIGDTITITANIQTNTNKQENLTVTYKLGTNNIGTSNVNNGKSTLKYTIPNLYRPTTYQLTITVTGNNFQNQTTTTRATFTKQAEKINIKVARTLQQIGYKAQLTANITTSTGGKISTGEATFYLDNKKLKTVNVTLGKASTNYQISSKAKSGVHTIKVTYHGTNDYQKAEATNILGIQTKTTITLKTHTTKIGTKAHIKATIKTGTTKVKSGKAIIYIGNKKIATTTIQNGNINHNYTIPTTYNKGTYNLKIVYNGNNTQTPATNTTKIKINGITPVFKYTTTKVTIGKTAKLILKISNGKTGKNKYNAQNGSITIKLNGKTLKDKNGKTITGTVKNGTITIKFTAPEQLSGKQNITFTYKGNNKFTTLTKTYKNGLIINKITTKLTVNKIKTTKYGNKITITGTLKDANNKILKNTNIKIKHNKKTITVKTNTKGIYKYTTTTNTVGNNNITITYPGNKKYQTRTIKTTYKTSKQNTKITINKIKNTKINKTITIKGTLKSINGKTLRNTKIKIKTNNKTVTVKTNTKGIYTYRYKVTQKGTNKITVTFTGNKNYNTKTIKTQFKAQT